MTLRSRLDLFDHPRIRRLVPARLKAKVALGELLGCLAQMSLRPESGSRVDLAYRLHRALAALPTREQREEMRAIVRRAPVLASMLERGYLAPRYRIDDLARYPAGSLGRLLHDHMTSRGLTLDFFPPHEPDDELEFLSLRGQQAHDYWHIVTGYDTDERGELAIIAFYLGNYLTHLDEAGPPLAVYIALLLGTSVLRFSFHRRSDLGPLFSAITDGWARGVNAEPLVAVEWERMWDRPVDAIRAELGIAPVALAN